MGFPTPEKLHKLSEENADALQGINAFRQNIDMAVLTMAMTQRVSAGRIADLKMMGEQLLQQVARLQADG